MQHNTVYTKGSARIFKSSFLEFFTKAHPLIIWGIYLPVIVLLIQYSYVSLGSTASHIVAIFTMGMLSWSLFEYITHRYLFHLVSQNPRTKRLIYVLHGNHHEYPHDRNRLFMPPVPSLILSSSVFGLMYLCMGREVFDFFPGFVLGYLLYGSMHYFIHSGPPPFPWLRKLWRNHHLHHYKDDDRGFGVSSTIWDHVFSSNFDLKQPKTVGRVRSRVPHDRERIQDSTLNGSGTRRSSLIEK